MLGAVDASFVSRTFAPERARDGNVRAPAAGQALSPEAQREVERLKARDREVRAHEAAHIAAGAGLIRSGASFEYDTGPDGKRYAVGGEVTIDTSPGRTPEETIDKAERIRRAALAPVDPSPQDYRVAAQAAQMAAEARLELARQQRSEATPASPGPAESTTSRRPLGAYADAAADFAGLVGQLVAVRA